MNHKLTQVNLEERTAVCSVCGPTTWRDRGKGKGRVCIARLRERSKRYAATAKGRIAMARGQKKFFSKHGATKSPWRKFVKPVCERCGIKPVDIVLMDGHHKDHNRQNNSEDNIESLCAFCHRLVHRGLEGLIVDAAPTNPPALPVKAPFPDNGVVLLNGEVEELKDDLEERGRQINLLLEDNDKLGKEIERLNALMLKVSRMSQDERFVILLKKYDDLRAYVGRKESDGSY